jgi:hypothetical protein
VSLWRGRRWSRRGEREDDGCSCPAQRLTGRRLLPNWPRLCSVRKTTAQLDVVSAPMPHLAMVGGAGAWPVVRSNKRLSDQRQRDQPQAGTHFVGQSTNEKPTKRVLGRPPQRRAMSPRSTEVERKSRAPPVRGSPGTLSANICRAVPSIALATRFPAPAEHGPLVGGQARPVYGMVRGGWIKWGADRLLRGRRRSFI